MGNHILQEYNCLHLSDGANGSWPRRSNLDYLSLDFNSASASPVQKASSPVLSFSRVSRSRLTSVRAWFTVTQSNKLIRHGERNALESEKHTSDRNELKNNRVTVHTVGLSRVCKVHPNVYSTTDPILTLSGWKDRGIWTQWLVMTYTWLLSYIVMQALAWKQSQHNRQLNVKSVEIKQRMGFLESPGQ